MVLKVNAGLFFRAEGGAAAAFGSKQGEGLPNIIGSINKAYLKSDSNPSVSGAFYGLNGIADGKYEGDNVNIGIYNYKFSAQKSNAIYGASSHVTPVNSTIRVWKRTA